MCLFVNVFFFSLNVFSYKVSISQRQVHNDRRFERFSLDRFRENRHRIVHPTNPNHFIGFICPILDVLFASSRQWCHSPSHDKKQLNILKIHVLETTFLLHTVLDESGYVCFSETSCWKRISAILRGHGPVESSLILLRRHFRSARGVLCCWYDLQCWFHYCALCWFCAGLFKSSLKCCVGWGKWEYRMSCFCGQKVSVTAGTKCSLSTRWLKYMSVGELWCVARERCRVGRTQVLLTCVCFRTPCDSLPEVFRFLFVEELYVRHSFRGTLKRWRTSNKGSVNIHEGILLEKTFGQNQSIWISLMWSDSTTLVFDVEKWQAESQVKNSLGVKVSSSLFWSVYCRSFLNVFSTVALELELKLSQVRFVLVMRSRTSLIVLFHDAPSIAFSPSSQYDLDSFDTQVWTLLKKMQLDPYWSKHKQQCWSATSRRIPKWILLKYCNVSRNDGTRRMISTLSSEGCQRIEEIFIFLTCPGGVVTLWRHMCFCWYAIHNVLCWEHILCNMFTFFQSNSKGQLT